ncbi:hypothetical protein SAMN02910358_00672 [Lachnospiraceae bacterium XBB1006]|nr:hypothetical protein SAMN02910358_00672 [Lachnospiraceae bacterium XBB1006]
MKKISLGVCLFLMVLLASGCSSTFETKESAVYVKDNGQVIEANVETFAQKYYDEKELKSFVEESIDAYNKEHDGKGVSLEELKVEDKKAKMFLAYESGKDFKQFHGEPFFAGTMAEAMSEGYALDDTFYKVEGKKLGKTVGSDELENDLQVVIMKERMGVKVSGTICYVSDNVKIVDENTVTPVRDEKHQIIENYGDEYIVVIYK